MSTFTNWIKAAFRDRKKTSLQVPFTVLFSVFQKILKYNNQVLELMAEMGIKLGGSYVFDQQYIRSTCHHMTDLVYKLIYNLNTIAPKKYLELYEAFGAIKNKIEEELAGRLVIPQTDYTMPYSLITDDFTDVVGGKNANLAEIKNLLGLATPEGFAVTTRAYQSFMEYNRLHPEVASLVTAWQKGDISQNQAGKQIQNLIMESQLPAPVQNAIHKALDWLYRHAVSEEILIAIRSSAISEDREHTFAGQYLSLLNVPRGNVLQSYKSILASTFSDSAMEYRFQKGFLDHEEAMAVGCQLMIDAKVSGVLYTLDPRFPEREMMLITAAWGLGAPVMEGKARADQYTVSREAPYPLMSIDIVRKANKLVLRKGGGTVAITVREDLQTKNCLFNEYMKQIVEAGLMIERHFKKPQNIEWAIDGNGKLFILQARPLNIKAQVAKLVCDISSVLDDYPVLFKNKGEIAEEGIGTGKVFLVKTDEELDNFPSGSILVTAYTSPRLGKVIKKASAIITDVGSPTGHMATIAREFRVPTIVNTGVATQLLHSGQEITVDARENVVYEGAVKALCYYEFAEETFEETYEYRLLQRVLKQIAPLNLLNPSEKNFTPSGCKTLHDITRFVHEKAVEELIDLEYAKVNDPNSAGKKLKFNIPLDLILIDIGGGLKATMNTSEIEPNDVTSVPMRAFLKGLAAPGAWDTKPMSVDFGSFMSSLTRTFSHSMANPRYVGQNLAVMSKEYVNIHLRLGYHFTMIVAYISEDLNDNYAYFRFLGGVTDMAHRTRRAKLIADILGKNDFRIDVRGDLVIARKKKLDLKMMEEKMQVLGLLVAFTRQLDVKMNSDQDITRLKEIFEEMKNNHIKRDKT
ncbi:MAG: PEP-utilizing enzyme [Desulfobacterales bacterium]|nr:PEP-utilizing enzyme [Desulfobacterales bacterium]